MGRSHGSRLLLLTMVALLRLAFATAPILKILTLLVKVTRRLIMQKARRHPYGAPTACKRMVSGSISLRYSRFFSPFPHGTGSLSVSQEYLALADGPARFIQGFTCPALLRIPLSTMVFTYTGLSPLYGQDFQLVLIITRQCRGPTTPLLPKQQRFWANPISLAATIGITFVFSSSGYLDVSVHRVYFSYEITCLQHAGLPHSDIYGSIRVCRSP